MEFKATIINMPESKIQNKPFEKWYQEIIKKWGGTDYQFNRDTLLNILNELHLYDIKVYENGLLITYFRDAYKVDNHLVDELEDVTPTEKASLFIFDNGEIYYINEGFSQIFCYSSYTGMIDNNNIKDPSKREFDISHIVNILLSKLGKEYTINDEKINSKNPFIVSKEEKKKKLIENKKKTVMYNISNSIKNGKYEETVTIFDPNTNNFIKQDTANHTK